MKKTIIFLCPLLLPAMAKAQLSSGYEINMEVFKITSTIAVFIIILYFILAVLQRILNHNIRRKIMEKGNPEAFRMDFLSPTPVDEKQATMKWASVFFGMGVAFTLIHYSMPLGLHSIAILAFSLAGSFITYYFYLRVSENRPERT